DRAKIPLEPIPARPVHGLLETNLPHPLQLLPRVRSCQRDPEGYFLIRQVGIVETLRCLLEKLHGSRILPSEEDLPLYGLQHGPEAGIDLGAEGRLGEIELPRCLAELALRGQRAREVLP